MRIARDDQIDPHLIRGLHAVDEGFVVSDQNSVYRIRGDGTVTRVLDLPLDRFFDVGEFVYGIGIRPPNAEPQPAVIYVSADEGMTWRLSAEYDPDLALLNFDEIDSQRVVGYYLDQLFALTIDPSSITVVELDNAGLEGSTVTSVTTHDSVAYVTTLSGVFTKPLADFWGERE